MIIEKKHHSLEHRIKISEKLRTNSSPHWWKSSHLWLSIKKEIQRRDNWTCQICGDKDFFCKSCGRYNMEVDHIKRAIDRPDLIFVLSNLRLLCRECHKKTPTYGHNIIKGLGRGSYHKKSVREIWTIS